jgi:hypothetical protein
MTRAPGASRMPLGSLGPLLRTAGIIALMLAPGFLLGLLAQQALLSVYRPCP